MTIYCLANEVCKKIGDLYINTSAKTHPNDQ